MRYLYWLLFPIVVPCLFAQATVDGFTKAQWVNLFNGKNLDGWEVIGDGVWTVMKDGTLLGQRTAKAQNASWVYTKKEFDEFDLRLEFWTRLGGNSGVAFRDKSRARYTILPDLDPNRFPCFVAYEVQINNGFNDRYPTGTLIALDNAPPGLALPYDWNSLEIQSRHEVIRVRLNGKPAAQHTGDPSRPKTGPIGLQLHDPSSIAMFRNIKIRFGDKP